MKTDGIFTTQLFDIPFKKYNEPITLWASGDWHINSPNHDKEKFNEFLKEADGDFFLGTGDYQDFISSSERKSLRSIEIHDSTTTTIEGLYENYVNELAEKLKNIKVLGLCGGNHYYVFKSSITSDQMLCQRIGCRYMGVNAFIRLLLSYDNHHRHAVDIVIHHGLSGGRTSGSSINKVEQMAQFFNADIVLQGHDHNISADYINRLGLSSNHILENKKILLGRTGSFLKAYEEGVPCYCVDSAYMPSSLGALKIMLTPKRVISNKQDRRWVEIRATI